MNERDSHQPPRRGETETICGLYRTTEALDDRVGEGALIFFHNHGDPGPGVYLPESWRNNRAIFSQHGISLPHENYIKTLEPLLPEGLYRVHDSFYCCEKRCYFFESEMLVQLGYNGDAEAILFVPELVDGALALPTDGTIVGEDKLLKLKSLKVAESSLPDSDQRH